VVRDVNARFLVRHIGPIWVACPAHLLFPLPACHFLIQDSSPCGCLPSGLDAFLEWAVSPACLFYRAKCTTSERSRTL
jgi:hypothetical protein